MRFPEWGISKSDPSEGVNCFWIMQGAMLIGSVDGPQSDKRQEQRAHLIAAAPDLLAALKNMVDACTSLDLDGSVIDDAKAALAKARGETA